MNFLYLTVVFAVCAYSTVIEKSDWDTKFENIVKGKCEENSKNPDAYNELVTAVKTLPECIMEDVEGEGPDIMKDLEGFCTFIKKINADSCLTTMGKKMSACLAEEEKYLPDFMKDLYTSTLDTLCGGEGSEELKKWISTTDGSQCFDGDDLIKIIGRKCGKKTKLVKMIDDEDYVMTKEDWCSDIETVKTCAIEELVEICTDDPTELLTKMFRPAMEACRK